MTDVDNTAKRRTKKNKEHIFRKRKPIKPEDGENVIYVNTKTSIKGQLGKCNKLVSQNHNEIIIYCLGAAVQRGVLLALQFCEQNVSYNCSTNTFSSELIDDLEPAVDDVDYEIQKRFNSALRIRLFRKDPLGNTSSDM